MEEASVFAKKFLEDLLSFFGLRVDVAVDLEEDMIQLDVPSTHLNGFLIGSRSETLRAIHSLTAAAVQQNKDQYYRLNIDIANYKKQKSSTTKSQGPSLDRRSQNKGHQERIGADACGRSAYHSSTGKLSRRHYGKCRRGDAKTHNYEKRHFSSIRILISSRS